MPRQRITDPHGLAGSRLALKGSAWYYRHRKDEAGKERWENLGRDLERAKLIAAHYNGQAEHYGSMAYWLDEFVRYFAGQVQIKKRSARTLKDYQKTSVYLKAFFGAMPPADIRAHHVQQYLDACQSTRSKRGNLEIATLSACFGWLMRSGSVEVASNPCSRSSGVKKNSQSARDRYVTSSEYESVYAMAPEPVKLMMELTYRTLQRPESDIIKWTVKNLAKDKDGNRVLKFIQNKGINKNPKELQIKLTPNLAEIIDKGIGRVIKVDQPLVHRGDKGFYTYTGLTSMLQRAVKKAGTQSFGFRDLKGKGATDMWQSGVPIEFIQQLCGHSNKSTTEIYVKQRWVDSLEPNRIVM